MTLAYRLGRTLQDIEAMSWAEFLEWIAYFEFQLDMSKRK